MGSILSHRLIPNIIRKQENLDIKEHRAQKAKDSSIQAEEEFTTRGTQTIPETCVSAQHNIHGPRFQVLLYAWSQVPSVSRIIAVLC